MSPVPLHEAIRAAYKGRVTQEALATAMGVDQTTVSRWSRDHPTQPTLLQVREIERLADRPPGWIDVQAGLLPAERTLPDAIRSAPELTEEARTVLLRAYEGAVLHSARRRAQ